MGPSVLQKAGVPHILRRFVATALAGTYYTMKPGGSNCSSVWATTTGVTPGSPLADAFFQAIFIHSLDELVSRIRGMQGENAVEQSEAGTVDPPPVAKWVDDEAILVEVEAPAMLVGRVSAMVTHAQAALAHVGVKANFDAGKTEVMLIFVGKHSRQQKLKWLAMDKPGIEVELLSGEVVPVVVTPEYQHVGNIVQHNGADEIDVARRKLLAKHMFAPLHKRVLFNPQLTFHEKRTLVLSMVGRKLLHGSGHWLYEVPKRPECSKLGICTTGGNAAAHFWAFPLQK